MTASKKKLLIMLAAVAAAALLLFLLTRDWSSCSCGDKQETAHSHADNIAASTDEDTLLIDRQSDDLESMVLTNKHGVYHISRGENGELDIADEHGIAPILKICNKFLSLFCAITEIIRTNITLINKGISDVLGSFCHIALVV